MAISRLKDRISRLPEQPGVYLYFNAAGDTLYVGKARVLRDRVRSYLGAYGVNPKTDALLDEADRVEVIVTDSVVEALALESNLIKQRAPKYNVLLRDDKSYPYLQLTTGEPFPRLLVARRVEKDEHAYYGPFLPASLARRTITLSHRLFGLRSCNEVITGQRGRPCLEYDIKRCIAPCVERLCSPEEYSRAVGDARLFLEGRRDELVDDLTDRMVDAASDERFEQAAHLRDAIRVVETLRDRQQKMATPGLGDRDAFGVRVGPAGAIVQVFQMRGGRVVERVELSGDGATGGDGSEVAVVEAAVQQFYDEQPAPPEIHLAVALPEAEALEEWLSTRAGRKVRLVVPKRGQKRGLLELATRNAALAYDTRLGDGGTSHVGALDALRAVLKLPAIPRRIECFDISTMQGAETVASMVVCEDGRMRRSEYRKFRIKGKAAGYGLQATGQKELALEEETGLTAHGARLTAHGARLTQERSGSGPPGLAVPSVDGEPEAACQPAEPGARSLRPALTPSVSRESRADGRILDDFASMHEVVFRRYRKAVESGGPFPDLILIDGGKGQLAAAYEALRALGLERLVAVGLAKQEELIFTRDAVDAIALPPESPALRLLQRIRDEAHRFAVTFHRRARTMRDLRSELDAIAGIGPRRRRSLLTRFGSVAGVRRATREELTSVVGAKGADAVLQYFAETRRT